MSEAYDALPFIAQGLRELGSVEAEQGAMVRRLRATTYKGLAKTIEFDAQTDEFTWGNGPFPHRVQNGTPRFLDRYDQVKDTRAGRDGRGGAADRRAPGLSGGCRRTGP